MREPERLNFVDDDGPGCHWIRGHVTADVAQRLVTKWDDYEPPVVGIRHAWFRIIPAPPSSDYDRLLIPAKEGARGAFRATVAYTDATLARVEGATLVQRTPEADRG